jgi:hypothetical protein
MKLVEINRWLIFDEDEMNHPLNGYYPSTLNLDAIKFVSYYEIPEDFPGEYVVNYVIGDFMESISVDQDSLTAIMDGLQELEIKRDLVDMPSTKDREFKYDKI